MNKGIVIIMSLLLAITGLVLLIHSSYFEVHQIVVDGNDQLVTEEIMRVVGDYKGYNIFLIPGREVVTKLMNYVRIKGVKLERDFPHTLIIKINERSGLGLFQTIKGKWVEISRDGNILGVYKGELPSNIPRVEGIKVKVVDKQVELNSELEYLLALIKAFFPIEKNITKVSYAPHDIIIYFKDRSILYFGGLEETEHKLQIYENIIEKMSNKRKKIKYIDLRYKGKPVIRLK